MGEVCVICPKVSSTIGVAGVVILCSFVSASDIAFSIHFPVFSCDVLYACVIFVISPDTLFVKFLNSQLLC